VGGAKKSVKTQEISELTGKYGETRIENAGTGALLELRGDLNRWRTRGFSRMGSIYCRIQ
jgi:hypothetical protein